MKLCLDFKKLRKSEVLKRISLLKGNEISATLEEIKLRTFAKELVLKSKIKRTLKNNLILNSKINELIENAKGKFKEEFKKFLKKEFRGN